MGVDRRGGGASLASDRYALWVGTTPFACELSDREVVLTAGTLVIADRSARWLLALRPLVGLAWFALLVLRQRFRRHA